MRLNRAPRFEETTHEGARAHPVSTMQALRRSVMAAMLWESEFYEDGISIAQRVSDLARNVAPEDLAELAIELRKEGKLRHMPLLLISILAETGTGRPGLVSGTIDEIISRPDDMGELISIHAHRKGVPLDKVKPVLTAQMKKGLARAFTKFDAYQLGKYNRDAAIRLRDVLFLTHARPASEVQKSVWEKLISGTLEAPDTWEVSLSGGADKKETFTRLIREGRLGYMALLRNLRGMMEAGVDRNLVVDALLARKGAANVLPFRFTAAARACPQLEAVIDEALCEQIQDLPRLNGKTAVLVDVSGSMNARISGKSDLSRRDAGATLASIIHGDELRVFTFSNDFVEVPPRRGMAGVDAVIRSQPHGMSWLGKAVGKLNGMGFDRLIVVTDEQSHDVVPDPVARHAYMINVASNRNGVGYGRWTHIDGFSENVLRYIHAFEHAREMEGR